MKSENPRNGHGDQTLTNLPSSKFDSLERNYELRELNSPNLFQCGLRKALEEVLVFCCFFWQFGTHLAFICEESAQPEKF